MSGPILLALRLALALALYAFLGWALLTLWMDLKRKSELLASSQAPPITLVLQTREGPRPMLFTTSEIILGRDPTSDCHLDDQTVSADHARLAFHHSQWWVEDLGSRNGTILNRELVREPMVLADGDQLRCGQVEMILSIGKKEA